jgi:WD40 repeat protein
VFALTPSGSQRSLSLADAHQVCGVVLRHCNTHHLAGYLQVREVARRGDACQACFSVPASLANGIWDSCGNDKLVQVWDVRAGGLRPSILLPNAHKLVVNSVAWRPSVAHYLISAGFDGVIHAWDLRFPAEPLHKLADHVAVARLQAIHHPHFFAGSGILTTTDKSKALFWYAADSGLLQKTLPLGVGQAPTCLSVAGVTLAAASGKTLLVLEPRVERAPEDIADGALRKRRRVSPC